MLARQLVGKDPPLQLILTGETISAQEAYRIGSSMKLLAMAAFEESACRDPSSPAAAGHIQEIEQERS